MFMDVPEEYAASVFRVEECNLDYIVTDLINVLLSNGSVNKQQQ
jgi:hypothetical protein